MDLQLNLIGGCLILLALVHLIFPRYFNWSAELASLNLINRQMMLVHTFFIALTVLLMGALCLTSADELISTVLGKRICLGLAVFWFTRLLIQFFGYSSSLWKGKVFETVVHVVFSFFWIYVSLVFFMVYIR